MHFKKSWLKWRSIILDDRELSHGAKSMALFLHTYMNDQNDMAWPSIETICGRYSLSNKTAIKHINELVDSGYLNKKKRFSSSCQYAIEYPSSVISTLMEEVHHSSVNSTLPVVEKLHSNKQENKQFNKQSLNGAKKRLFLCKDNEKMKDFAIRNGMSEPWSGEGWDSYRNRLQGEIDKRNRENGFE